MINYNAPEQNPKPQSKYGNLAFTPKDFERHWWIETSLKPEYLQETFRNPGNAGPLQLTRPAFDDLKRFGYFKEKTFEQLTPQEALAGSMMYKTKLKENYGLDNPGWNIVGYKEGPTLARRFKERYNGDLLKAMNDPEFPIPARKYIMKYLRADRELRDKEPPAAIKEMYQAILKGEDVNKVDFKKYNVPKAVTGGELQFLTSLAGGQGGQGGAQGLAGMLGGSGGGENDKLKKFAPKMPTAEDIMFMPKFTKAMGPLGPAATAAGDMIGMQEDADKQDFMAGTALSGIGGFLSAGPVGGILGLGSGLVKYGFNAADNARQKQQEEQAFIKSRTIGGRDGLENPLVYAQKGIELKGTKAAKAMKGLWNATKFGTDALGKAGAVSTLQKYMPGQESQNFALGGYSVEGYKEDSPDKNNPYNLIPGNRITMEGVRRALMAIPISNGIPMGVHMMKPGEEYEFEDADEVLEIPKKELGGYVAGQELELTNAEIKTLIRKGYKLQIL